MRVRALFQFLLALDSGLIYKSGLERLKNKRKKWSNCHPKITNG
jgi:hypothetical protein